MTRGNTGNNCHWLRAAVISDIVSAAAGDIGVFGYMIVALFVLTWLVSLLVYRLKGPHKISA